MRHAWSSALGVVLVVLGSILGLHAVCASVSSLIYHGARYSGWTGTPEAVLDRCERAYAWHRYNHAMCVWAGEYAYYHRCDDSGRDIAARLDSSFLWGRRAIALNPRSSQARMLETHRIARSSPADAIRYWEEYVDWNYWSPHSHLPLVDLYAKAGLFDLALREVRFVVGTECEPSARCLIKYWWDRERQSMQEVADRQTQRPQP